MTAGRGVAPPPVCSPNHISRLHHHPAAKQEERHERKSSSPLSLRPKTLSLAGFSLSIFVVGGWEVVWWAAKSWFGAHALFPERRIAVEKKAPLKSSRGSEERQSRAGRRSAGQKRKKKIENETKAKSGRRPTREEITKQQRKGKKENEHQRRTSLPLPLCARMQLQTRNASREKERNSLPVVGVLLALPPAAVSLFSKPFAPTKNPFSMSRLVSLFSHSGRHHRHPPTKSPSLNSPSLTQQSTLSAPVFSSSQKKQHATIIINQKSSSAFFFFFLSFFEFL